LQLSLPVGNHLEGDNVTGLQAPGLGGAGLLGELLHGWRWQGCAVPAGCLREGQ